MAGCGDGRWQHVYHPTRLIVKQDCLTVTGTIVDATATQSHHQPDGVRHEGDGDTHGWLQLDPPCKLINAGNTSTKAGISSRDRASLRWCAGRRGCLAPIHRPHTIPPVGTHVAIPARSSRKRITRSGTRSIRCLVSRCSDGQRRLIPVIRPRRILVQRVSTRFVDTGGVIVSNQSPGRQGR